MKLLQSYQVGYISDKINGIGIFDIMIIMIIYIDYAVVCRLNIIDFVLEELQVWEH